MIWRLKGSSEAFCSLCVDHHFLNHKDCTQLSAPIGIRHFGEIPM